MDSTSTFSHRARLRLMFLFNFRILWRNGKITMNIFLLPRIHPIISLHRGINKDNFQLELTFYANDLLARHMTFRGGGAHLFATPVRHTCSYYFCCHFVSWIIGNASNLFTWPSTIYVLVKLVHITFYNICSSQTCSHNLLQYMF